MPNTRLPNSIFFLLIAVAAGQFFYYSARLPQMLASHFSGPGSVNGWETKAAFFSIEVTIIALATMISFGVPRMIAAMPVSMINLPHKDFWLSAERRDGTLSYLGMWTAWCGCALLAFLLYVMELVFRANLHAPPRFNNSAFLPALLTFAVFHTVAIFRLILHFSKPQPD